MFVSHRLFKNQGWVGGITHLTAWVFEMGCWLHLFLTCGGLCSAMDVMLMAEAYRLGVKRSSISLPWESTAYGAVFGKKPRLISAPRFVPLPFQQEEDSTLVQKEVHGKVTWSRITSVIPWPVTQERDLGKSLGKLANHCYGQHGSITPGPSNLQYTGWHCNGHDSRTSHQGLVGSESCFNSAVACIVYHVIRTLEKVFG